MSIVSIPETSNNSNKSYKCRVDYCAIEKQKRDELFEQIETAANKIIKKNFYIGLTYLLLLLVVLTCFTKPPKSSLRNKQS